MTKQFSKEQAVTSAKSDIWASFRLVPAIQKRNQENFQETVDIAGRLGRADIDGD